MSQPSISIRCPDCEAALATTLAPADGGRPEPTDELYGKEVRCRNCENALEVLFYPGPTADRDAVE